MDAKEFRFALHARDFDRSVQFYRDTLDMAYISGWDRPDGKGALLSAGGTAVIEIFGAAAGTAYEGPAPAAVSLSLKVESMAALEAWHDRLKPLVAEPPTNHPWGHRSFMLFDPDGLPVHIYCELD